jgi:hypothetical protein
MVTQVLPTITRLHGYNGLLFVTEVNTAQHRRVCIISRKLLVLKTNVRTSVSITSSIHFANMSYRDLEKLDLSDTEDLFASPSQTPSRSAKLPKTEEDETPAQPRGESKYDAEAAREAALKKELESLRNMNNVIEGVISSLEKAKGNMGTVSKTVGNASTLLNTWTRILSQTEHNQRLILNPNWKGATQDIIDTENEVILKAQAAERRAAEEARRREEAKLRAEDEERQRQAGTATRGTRGTRARGGLTRGTTRPGYVGVGGQGGAGSSIGRPSSAASGRGTSGIGRGIPSSTRGRARGVR